MKKEPEEINVINLIRSIFESVYGGFGLMAFNIDELIPIYSTNGKQPIGWKMICNFRQSLTSNKSTKYGIMVNCHRIFFKVKHEINYLKIIN